MTERQARILIVLVSLGLALAAGAALRATYIVTMPLVFAFFLAVLVWPVHEGMRRRLPERVEWLATATTILGILIVMAGVLAGISFLILEIASERGEEIVGEVTDRWEVISQELAARGFPMPEDGENNGMLEPLLEWLGAAALSLTGVSTVLVLIVFFTLLMLVEAHHWREKSRTSLPAGGFGSAMAAISRQVRAFLLVQAAVAFITAVVTGIWIWVMGVPFVLLWVLLTFLVDFVPNIGPVVAGIAVSLIALVALGWERAVLTGVGILAIQQFFGNYVDPLLKGRRMDISPLIVLLSVVFWAWVWGPAGAILAVPITATLIIACAHVPALKPIALMLAHTADEERLEEQTGSG